MVYFYKFATCVSQTIKATKNVFRIIFCIWMASFCVHVCTFKLHSMSTCRQHKHTYTCRHLVEAGNAIPNCENMTTPYAPICGMIEVDRK